MLNTKRNLVGLIFGLICVCLSLFMATPAFAHSSHLSDSHVTPNASGGGCYDSTDVYAFVASCISEGSNYYIYPDTYVRGANGASARGWTSCSGAVQLYDNNNYVGSVSFNCLSALRGSFTGHYYGPAIHAQAGHMYMEETIGLAYRGSNYYSLNNFSPEQYA